MNLGLHGLRRVSALVAAAALAACGGDDGDRTRTTASSVTPTASAPTARLRALALATDPTTLEEIERLMNWAEEVLPTVFTSRETTRTLDPFRYRFYPGSGHFLAVEGRTVLALGPLTNNQALVLGTLDDFACIDDLARCVAPSVDQQPQAVSVAPGAEARFSAVVSGGPAVRLQWLRNGEPIGVATSTTFSFTATAADNGARFSLRAENAKGTVTSEAATLTVVTPIDGAAMQALAEARGCFECHSVDRAGTGPGWRAVAQRYDGVANAENRLVGSIFNGSSRQWGLGSAMPAQPVSVEEARNLAAWILSLK